MLLYSRQLTHSSSLAPLVYFSYLTRTSTSRFSDTRASSISSSVFAHRSSSSLLNSSLFNYRNLSTSPPVYTPTLPLPIMSSSSTSTSHQSEGALPSLPEVPKQDTKMWKVDPTSSLQVLKEQLKEPAQLLMEGKTVAFPTETVYGLGANALSSASLSQIFEAKGRPSDNPLIVHLHSLTQLPRYVDTSRVGPVTERIMKKFWPGPLTIVFPSKEEADGGVSIKARANLPSVAIRIPNHPVALALLTVCDLPIAAPSANLSGKPSPTTAQHVAHDLHTRIAGIVDGGMSEGIGVESTVVEIHESEQHTPFVMILRPGGVTKEMLEEIVGAGNVQLDPSILKYSVEEQSKESKQSATAQSSSSVDSVIPGPKAPGMKYTHYAPTAPLTIVYGDDEFFLQLALDKLQHLSPTTDTSSTPELIGILATKQRIAHFQVLLASAEHKHKYTSLVSSLYFQTCGEEGDYLSISRELYHSLRMFDENAHVKYILAQGVEEKGVGSAIMNRLIKAASQNVVHQSK